MGAICLLATFCRNSKRENQAIALILITLKQGEKSFAVNYPSGSRAFSAFATES